MSEVLEVPKTGLVGLDGRVIAKRDPNKPFWMHDGQDDKDLIFNSLGDLDDIDVYYNWVLLVKYVREVVAEGILASKDTQNEDKWQGKVGLIVKKGPAAFKEDLYLKAKFYGANPEVGDWVYYYYSDGWDTSIGQKTKRLGYLDCRLIQDSHIIGRVKYPGRIY